MRYRHQNLNASKVLPRHVFMTYERNIFSLARNVIMWWTPARVEDEDEALRLTGDVEGPSVLSEEA